MPRLHLVRHAKAAAGWTDHRDPGLDALGREQAASVAALLGPGLSPRQIWSSPLLRTQQSAAPLAEAWATTIGIDGRFGEVPSPSADPGERGAWLGSVMVSRWTDLGPAVDLWRERLIGAVRGATDDAVVFTHFVAINAVVARAEGHRQVMVFAPANASVTIVDVDRSTGRLVIVERGNEATSEVR